MAVKGTVALAPVGPENGSWIRKWFSNQGT